MFFFVNTACSDR